MAARGDEELVAIVRAPADEWEPDAVEAAHAEIEQRKLTEDQREELHAELARIEEKAGRPLPTSAKVIAYASGVVMFPGLLVILLLAGYYRKRHETLKAREIVRWWLLGTVTVILGSIAFAACGR